MAATQRGTIGTRLVWAATAVTALAVLLVLLTTVRLQYQNARIVAAEAIQRIGDALAADLDARLQSSTDASPEALLRTVATEARLQSIYLLDSEGQIVARAEREPTPLELVPDSTTRQGHFLHGDSLRYTKEMSDGQRLAIISPVENFSAFVPGMTMQIVLVGLFCIGLIWLIVRTMTHSVFAPVREVASLMEQATRTRDYSLRTRTQSTAFAELTESFDKLLARVQTNEQNLRMAEQALGHSEERFRKIVDNAMDAVVTMNSDGIITGWNSQAERTFGWVASEAIGKPLHELMIPLAHREAHLRGLKRFLVTGEGPLLNRRVEFSALRRSGEEFAVEVAITSITIEDSIQFCAFIEDITHRKAAENMMKDREARFRAVVDTAADGIATINHRGIIEFVNPSFERMFGYHADELIGRNVRIIIPEPDKSSHDQYIERFRKTREPKIIGTGREVQGQKKSGEIFPIHLSIASFEIGGEEYFTGIIQDLSLSKQTEDALVSERRLLRALIDNAPDCIYVKDSESRFLLNNPAHLRMLGVKNQEDSLGRDDFDFFARQLAQRYRSDDELMVRTGKPILNREEPVVDPSGRVRWMATSKIPLVDENGSAVRIVGISRDITDLREARERLETINDELTQKNQEMEQFVYTVSHDLKSPIVTCVGFLGLMREDLAANEYSNLPASMDRLERAVSRMHQSINDLLELSRVGRVRSQVEDLNMNELLTQILSDLRPRLEELDFETHLEPNLPSIIADRTRVMEVFENLINNAMKYAADSDRKRIEIGAEMIDEETRYYVRDFGQGIEKEYHKRIFGLFQRLDNKQEGTGVGLTIVARIMEVHGGRVWVESEPGHGATFWLAFPLAVMDPHMAESSGQPEQVE